MSTARPPVPSNNQIFSTSTGLAPIDTSKRYPTAPGSGSSATATPTKRRDPPEFYASPSVAMSQPGSFPGIPPLSEGVPPMKQHKQGTSNVVYLMLKNLFRKRLQKIKNPMQRERESYKAKKR
jgi:hypothetical protein